MSIESAQGARRAQSLCLCRASAPRAGAASRSTREGRPPPPAARKAPAKYSRALAAPLHSTAVLLCERGCRVCPPPGATCPQMFSRRPLPLPGSGGGHPAQRARKIRASRTQGAWGYHQTSAASRVRCGTAVARRVRMQDAAAAAAAAGEFRALERAALRRPCVCVCVCAHARLCAMRFRARPHGRVCCACAACVHACVTCVCVCECARVNVCV